MRTFISFIVTRIFFMNNPFHLHGCTNFIITRGASSDSSTMVTYVADSHTQYGELYYWPARDHRKGSMIDIFEWETNRFLGQITQVDHSYKVIGNMNEFQLVISETTFL